MKSKGFDLSIRRQSLSLFAAVKFVILASLIVLFLNVTLSLYTNISTRYYSSIKQPIFKICSSYYSTSSSNSCELKNFSSSSANYSSLIATDPIYQPNYTIVQGSSSRSPPTNPSPNSNSMSSLLLLSSPPPVLNLPTSLSSNFLPSTKLDQPSTYSPLPSILPPLTSIDSHSRWASNNLDNSSISSHILSPLISSLPSPPCFNPISPQRLIQNDSSYANVSSSISSTSSSTAITLNRERLITRKRLPKGCDLSKGEWVQDPNAPYYTNSTCWTIQEHQNCMKYGRPDLDFLNWKWKPDGCELPLLDPAQFLELMRGKNLAFIGDSLARNQMQSLMCLLSKVEYPKETSTPSEENLTRMFYPKHNFTIWIFWSPFLVRAEQSKHTIYNFTAWNLYLDEPDPLWPPHLSNFDYLVLNTGNWYTRPTLFHLSQTLVGCHYCPIPNAPFMSMRRAHRRAFQTALNAVAGANRHGFMGMTVVRTVSPSHFEGGELNKGGDCARKGPFRRRDAPRLEGLERDMYKEQLKEFWKAKWEGSERGLDFRLLDTTHAMLMRPDGHPSKYGHWPDEKRVTMYNDCVHWCLPGPVDMWNEFLFQLITI